jgi:hypothetical protein
MTESGLISRHRNKDGEISRKHGNTLIRTLRKAYGPALRHELLGRGQVERRAAQNRRAVA